MLEPIKFSAVIMCTFVSLTLAAYAGGALGGFALSPGKTRIAASAAASKQIAATIGNHFRFSVACDWRRPSIAVVGAVVLSSEILFSSHSQSINSQGGTGNGTAKLKIIANFRDVKKHVFQIPGNRNLFDWEGQLSARNPKPRSAAGIIAGHQVRTMAQKFRDV